MLVLGAAAPPAQNSERAIARAFALYESAYHPDTGERIPLVGRMCFQAPGAAPLTAAMLACHRSLPATLALQWVNQSFMAVCNWSNRNARGAEADDAAVLVAYFGATFGSLATAFSLKRYLPKSWSILVPAAAISVASLVNVPCMRSNELRDGLVVEDEYGVPLEARSRAAACYAIAAVTVSRILNGTADLFVIPAVVGAAKLRGYKWAHNTSPRVTIPLYGCLCFATISVTTPLTTAIAPQRASLPAAWCDDDLRTEINGRTERVFFNKGL